MMERITIIEAKSFRANYFEELDVKFNSWIDEHPYVVSIIHAYQYSLQGQFYLFIIFERFK